MAPPSPPVSATADWKRSASAARAAKTCSSALEWSHVRTDRPPKRLEVGRRATRRAESVRVGEQDVNRKDGMGISLDMKGASPKCCMLRLRSCDGRNTRGALDSMNCGSQVMFIYNRSCLDDVATCPNHALIPTIPGPRHEPSVFPKEMRHAVACHRHGHQLRHHPAGAVACRSPGQAVLMRKGGT